MNRDYETGTADNVVFFTGIEVEKTPAYGMETLFVTGVQDVSTIKSHLDDKTKHIFFGANHSFIAGTFDEWTAWEKMITPFLEQGYMCSLDINIKYAESFLEGPLVEHENFIPQLRVPIPYIKLWNYNTMLKIDDKDFKATNPGVWCHSLHELMDRDKFTDWQQYTLDKPLD
jgi:hypothetical protein